MGASLQFEIVERTDDGIYALKVRVFGLDDRGEQRDEVFTLPEPMYPEEIGKVIGKINGGEARRAGQSEGSE